MAAKALITQYNGHKFKNQLAARWAVFFDTARIDYLVETQPFELADGLSYTPDFYLKRGIRFLGEEKPRQDVWVSLVQDAELPEYERETVVGFVLETGKNILLIAGTPDVEAEVLFIGRNEEMGLDAAEVSFMALADGQSGLVAERALARLDREQDRALIERRKRTERLTEAYRAGRETQFDRRMRRCRVCGRQFQPNNWFDSACYSCHSESATRARTGKGGLDFESLLRSVSPTQRRIALSVFVAAVIGLCAWSACQVVSLPGAAFAWLEPEVRPTTTPPLPATYTPVPTPVVKMEGLAPGIVVTRDICSCSADLYECSDFASEEEAQACFDFCQSFKGDVHRLDEDGDGQVCAVGP